MGTLLSIQPPIQIPTIHYIQKEKKNRSPKFRVHDSGNRHGQTCTRVMADILKETETTEAAIKDAINQGEIAEVVSQAIVEVNS